MKVVLLGPPGVGKGTQSQYISDHYEIPSISTGEMLRRAVEAKTPLGIRIESIMAAGDLVPDDIIINLVKERIAQSDCGHGFVLDGFPRTVRQAEILLMSGIAIDAIVELFVPEEELVNRLSGRWIHPGSHRIYHEAYNPPIRPGHDDLTGEPLIQREDDKEETVRHRLAVYYQETQPIIAYYDRLAITDPKRASRQIRVDGTQSPAAVFETILMNLEEIEE